MTHPAAVYTPRRRLAGQVTIVTGGGSGIGRATALALAREGAAVVVVGRTSARVVETVGAIQDVAGEAATLGLSLDVRRENDMREMVERTLACFGRVDILVAAAGVLRGPEHRPRLLWETSLAEWNAVLDTNLRGTFLSNRAVLGPMIARRDGQIVNLSSLSGRQGRAFDAAYCASKFGIVGLTESLAEEVRPYGIRVCAVLPGPVDTPILDQNGSIPRPAELLPPERVAELILFLLAQPLDASMPSPVILPFRLGLAGRPTSEPTASRLVAAGARESAPV